MTAAIEREVFLAHLNRPGATPAPTPPSQPTPPMPPASPWQPRHSDDPGLHRWAPNADRQRLTKLLADIERLLNGPVK